MNESRVTSESIRDAKAFQQAARDRVFAKTGLRITNSAALVRVHCICGGCRFVASATTEGRALRSLAPHLVRSHGWAPKGAA